MKGWIGWLVKAYAVVAAYLLALAALVGIALFWRGAVTSERVQEAFQVLRGRPVVSERVPERMPPGAAAERERILDQRTAQLDKLEARVNDRLALLRAEEETLESKREQAARVIQQARKSGEETAQARAEAELSANVPILSRMEAPGIIEVLREGDDAQFVRYLHALRPAKAAEVLEALRTDPQYEDDFRRLPAGAPPGAKTRSERLYEEFRKGS